MKGALLLVAGLLATPGLHAQVAGKFPPDTLTNVQVFPSATPVGQLVGTMRDFTSALGVRCSYCHVGSEGQPLAEYDFPSDSLRTKRVARQMMLMVREINRRIDTLPERPDSSVRVSCVTCHRGVSRPVPLDAIIAQAAIDASADSARSLYRTLRSRFYGRDTYDFTEGTLNDAALQVARRGHREAALDLLALNDSLYPTRAGVENVRGLVALLNADTVNAVRHFREALRRDPRNREAASRLRQLE